MSGNKHAEQIAGRQHQNKTTRCSSSTSCYPLLIISSLEEKWVGRIPTAKTRMLTAKHSPNTWELLEGNDAWNKIQVDMSSQTNGGWLQ